MNRIFNLAVPIAMAAVLAACGKQDAPPAPSAPAPQAQAPAAAPAPQAAAPAANPLGEGAYKKTCALCHAAGVGGAPKTGDAADWGARAAKGKDPLYTHAIAGFTGEKGMMPPKGGNAALSDDEVKAAVDFMVDKSK
ncbi:cytochrome c5 family protein [Zoogloea sp.]|uniref:c-type cytochrome n=1 Tax=Zoogloea sp. TaxID=49181 RepID=UPI0035AFA291